MTGIATKTLVLGCDPYVYLTISEDEGNLAFTLTGDPDAIAAYDLDGIFLNFTNPDALDGLEVFPFTNTELVTDFEVALDSLNSLNNGAELVDNYDVSIQFGTVADSTEGEVVTVGFTLFSPTPLTVDDIDTDSIALVVDSDTPDGQVLLVDDNDPTTDECYDLPEEPEDCINVAEGADCVFDLDAGTSTVGPEVAADAELANVVITKDGETKIEVEKLVDDKNNASDIIITDSAGTDISKLSLEKMGKDDGESDVFRIDLATFDDDFEITIKSEDDQDVIAFDNVDSSSVDGNGVYTITYTGTDGQSHTVTLDPKDAQVVVGDSDAPGDEGVTYSIVGGADAALFEVDPDTGEVCFVTPPDYENPTDSNGDNRYEVTVRATQDDGSFEDSDLDFCVQDDCIKIEEGTSDVIDLDCGTPEIPDIGTDLCEVDGGKPTALTLTYSFGEAFDQANPQDSDKLSVTTNGTDDDGTVFIRVTDKDGNAFFEGEVSEGQAFTADNGEKLQSETFVEIYDTEGGTLLQEIEFHTSCSQPLTIGDTFASVTLAGATLEDGSVVGLDPADAGDGDGGVYYEITGGEDQDLFTVDPDTGEVSFINPPEFVVGGDNEYHVTITAFNDEGTVCDEFKLDVCVENDCIKVIENDTGPVADLDCGIEPNPDTGLEICAERERLKDVENVDSTKPTILTFALNATLESTINSGQEGGKLDVETFELTNDDGGGLFILVSNDSDPQYTDQVYFSGDVEFGESFTAAAADGGRNEFGSETYIHVFDSSGGTLLQTINYHTSCSAPITIGDQVGLVSLQGVALEDKDTGDLIEYGGEGGPGDDGVSYELSGPDADDFVVDPDTGEVSFAESPDYEDPQDANFDNIYEVTVTAYDADGNVCDVQDLEICVEDEDDDPICVAEGQTAVADFNLEVDCTEPGGDDGTLICQFQDDGKPIELELTYEFGTTFEQTLDQDADKRDLQTFDDDGDDDGISYIRVLDKDGNELFADNVQEGGSFVVDNDGERFDSETHVEIYDEQGGALIQDIEFHTSCSQPLAIGDTFGSINLTGATLESGRSFEGETSITLSEGQVVYSVSGGADEDAFTVDPETGILSFISAPDPLAPGDADGNGVFQVTVRATAEDDPDCYTEETIEVEVCTDEQDDGLLMLPIIESEDDEMLDDMEDEDLLMEA
ncbi:cadherin repeat domain-containing protein [Aestuariicoccus sp. MJ-SS9]|uniref:cadherin repeat domain-containing protein n=1 Tax=Aestuariicoccus sp. MJ-SS9 TaxID=3079855 RepID=UPI0029142D75|nr:cadherin repeat domain-containing protein [Aestuariicoccus sp. MJ-SS9]MDU8913535.1 cadherin repeat domain-containing protein [Aestuariicoccus sp. MJ-SS9]